MPLCYFLCINGDCRHRTQDCFNRILFLFGVFFLTWSVQTTNKINCSSDGAMRWTTKEPWVGFQQGQEIFLFKTMNQFWDHTSLLTSCFRGESGWGSKLTTSLHVVSRLRTYGAYLHSPIWLHSSVLD
jgi:hypothetical protein